MTSNGEGSSSGMTELERQLRKEKQALHLWTLQGMAWFKKNELESAEDYKLRMEKTLDFSHHMLAKATWELHNENLQNSIAMVEDAFGIPVFPAPESLDPENNVHNISEPLAPNPPIEGNGFEEPQLAPQNPIPQPVVANGVDWANPNAPHNGGWIEEDDLEEEPMEEEEEPMVEEAQENIVFGEPVPDENGQVFMHELVQFLGLDPATAIQNPNIWLNDEENIYSWEEVPPTPEMIELSSDEDSEV